MNKNKWLFIAASIASILLWPMADRSILVYGQANPVVTVEKGTFDGDLLNPCTGEVIKTTYKWHLINRVTFDANGRPHLSTHLVWSDLKGIGVDGTKYTGVGIILASTNGAELDPDGNPMNGEPPWEHTYIGLGKAQGQGSAPNFIIKYMFHTTVNANGETTTDIPRVSVRCE